jgi:hypothetical protein
MIATRLGAAHPNQSSCWCPSSSGAAAHGRATYSWPDPHAILAARYARGEITHEEYRERLGHASGPDHAADRFGVLFFKPGRRSPRRRR